MRIRYLNLLYYLKGAFYSVSISLQVVHKHCLNSELIQINVGSRFVVVCGGGTTFSFGNGMSEMSMSVRILKRETLFELFHGKLRIKKEEVASNVRTFGLIFNQNKKECIRSVESLSSINGKTL